MTTLLTVLLILFLVVCLACMVHGMMNGDVLCWVWYCLGGMEDLLGLIGSLVSSLAGGGDE
jgi:hypothetical protein